MSNLSASAIIILDYAKEHAAENGYVDLQDYTGFPERIVISSCEELLRHGFISSVEYSSDSVEYIMLKEK